MGNKQETVAPKKLCSPASVQAGFSVRPHTERGASMVENALVVALIFAVAIAAVRVTGRSVSQQFSSVQAQLSPSNSCSCPTQVSYVTAVYQQVLRREPDAGGLSFWVSMMNGGGTTREGFLQIACSCGEYNELVSSSGTQSQACTGGSITCSCS